MSNLIFLKSELKQAGNPERAKILQRYFKTGKGEYGERDIFLGITVPEQRKIAKRFYDNLSLSEVQTLLNSRIHEERFTALEILNFKYSSSAEKEKRKIIGFYLKNTAKINNWDLVDTSAPYLLGDFLNNKDKSILYKFAKSEDLWKKRISIIATYHFIKNNQFHDTLKIAEILLNDKHDLIQKAVGWMLREIGKRNQEVLETFLKNNCKNMPRTMLRYSIEKFPQEKRQAYLSGLI